MYFYHLNIWRERKMLFQKLFFIDDKRIHRLHKKHEDETTWIHVEKRIVDLKEFFFFYIHLWSPFVAWNWIDYWRISHHLFFLETSTPLNMQVILHLPLKRMDSNKENTQVINRSKQIIIFQKEKKKRTKNNNIPFQIFFIGFVRLADSSFLLNHA